MPPIPRCAHRLPNSRFKHKIPPHPPSPWAYPSTIEDVWKVSTNQSALLFTCLAPNEAVFGVSNYRLSLLKVGSPDPWTPYPPRVPYPG